MNNPYKELYNYPGLAKDEIAVGVDFSEMASNAPEFFESEGKQYKRDVIGLIPASLVGKVCSVRIYKLV